MKSIEVGNVMRYGAKNIAKIEKLFSRKYSMRVSDSKSFHSETIVDVRVQCYKIRRNVRIQRIYRLSPVFAKFFHLIFSKLKRNQTSNT